MSCSFFGVPPIRNTVKGGCRTVSYNGMGLDRIRTEHSGNSRENQLEFFSLDHGKLFSLSRSRLETQD